jgi:bifunctional DNase/RNase
MLKPMFIAVVAVDALSKSPVVILKEVDGKRMLPIWIGLLEADAIASELERVKFPRPMTHDLLKTIMESMEVEVNRVEVCDLKDNTYYALIHIAHRGKEIAIDARPSDALALSLRVNAPIFAAEAVINRSRQLNLKIVKEGTLEDGEDWKDLLESIDPDDFGNT